MINMWKQMMGNMVINPAKNKISQSAEGVKIIGTFNLIHKPGGVNNSIFIRFWIYGAAYMMGYKKGKQCVYGLNHVHCQKCY